MEQEIVEEINRVRKNPRAYAAHLEDLKALYRGKERKLSDRTFLVTQEGVAAVEEAIQKLRVARPRGRLQWNGFLSESALEHVRDTGPTGRVGHQSANGKGFETRIRRHLSRFHRVGENISYGSTAAAEVVQDLIIDDGVADRGHRKNIFDPAYTVAGAACGPHARYGMMCVIDFARP